RAHPVGRMNRFVVEAVQINRVRTINSDFPVIDEPSDRIDETEVLILIIAAKRSRKQNQRKPAAVSKRKHLELPTEPGRVPFQVAFVHIFLSFRAKSEAKSRNLLFLIKIC